MVYAIPLRPGACSSEEMIQEKEMFYQAVDAFGLEDTMKAWEPTWSRPVMLRWHMMREKKEPEPVATQKKPMYREEVRQEVCAYVKKHGLKAATKHYHKIPQSTIFFWWNKHPSNPKTGAVGSGTPYPKEFRTEVFEYLKKHGTTATRKRWPDINENTLYNWKWQVDQEKETPAPLEAKKITSPMAHPLLQGIEENPAPIFVNQKPQPAVPKEFTVKIGKISISCPDLEALEQLVNKFGG